MMNTRTISTLPVAFTDIANAIRTIDGTEASISPLNMPQRILSAFEMEDTITPSPNLNSVFSCIASSIRACGMSGTMKVDEMPNLIIAIPEPTISANSTFIGKVILCNCLVRGVPVAATYWRLTSGGEYATINQNGRIDVNEGVYNQSLTIQCSCRGSTVEKTIRVSYDNQLSIECLDKLVGTTANVVARYNGEVVSPTWSIVGGSENATIASNGTVTIIKSGVATIQAAYNNYVTTRSVILKYASNGTTITTINDDGSVVGETQIAVENPDESTTTNSTTITTDGNGYTTKSIGTCTVNEDGSSTRSTTNYDGQEEPIDIINQDIDVDGNALTQSITYDD